MREKRITRTVKTYNYLVKAVNKEDEVIKIDYETPTKYREGKELEDFKKEAAILLTEERIEPCSVEFVSSREELRACSEKEFIAISKAVKKAEEE